MGHGPSGSLKIDPDVGAPQVEIQRSYKQALFRAYTEDAVALDEEERIRKGIAMRIASREGNDCTVNNTLASY